MKKITRPNSKINRRALRDITDLRNSDERINSILKRIKRMVKAHDSEAMFKELMTMHAARMTRVLTAGDVLMVEQRRFIEATLQNSAYRSRTVELQVNAYKIAAQLEDLLHTLRAYVRSNYTAELRSQGSTQADRHSFVDSLFAYEVSLKKKFENVSETADILLADFDAAGWSGRRIIEILSLTHTDRKAN